MKQRNVYSRAWGRYEALLEHLEWFLENNPEVEWNAMELVDVLGTDYNTWRAMARWCREHVTHVPWFGYRPPKGTARSGTYFYRGVCTPKEMSGKTREWRAGFLAGIEYAKINFGTHG
jgi:hypothetical protein